MTFSPQLALLNYFGKAPWSHNQLAFEHLLSLLFKKHEHVRLVAQVSGIQLSFISGS